MTLARLGVFHFSPIAGARLRAKPVHLTVLPLAYDNRVYRPLPSRIKQSDKISGTERGFVIFFVTFFVTGVFSSHFLLNTKHRSSPVRSEARPRQHALTHRNVDQYLTAADDGRNTVAATGYSPSRFGKTTCGHALNVRVADHLTWSQQPRSTQSPYSHQEEA